MCVYAAVLRHVSRRMNYPNLNPTVKANSIELKCLDLKERKHLNFTLNS